MPAFLVPMENGRRIPIDKAVLFIGRHPDCDVVLNFSRKVSRRHCCLAVVNERLIVRDLNSMNGVRINGQRIRKEGYLRQGDELMIGDVGFLLESVDKEQLLETPQDSDRDSDLAEPRASGPRIARPIDLSQDVPVPIPDDDIPHGHAEVLVEPNLDPGDPDRPDEKNSGIIVIDDSSEFPKFDKTDSPSDPGPRIEILSD